MEKSKFEVKEALAEDAASIVFVQASSWVANYQNYEHNILLDDIRSIDFNAKIGQWQHILASQSYKVWVAYKDNKIVAFLAALIGNEGGEIFEQHTLPEYSRQGMGSNLLKKALDWLGNNRDIYLRIPIYSKSGVEFYKKHGFAIYEEGEVDFIRTPSGKRISTVMMFKPIDLTPQQAVRPSVKPEAAETKAPVKKIVGRAQLAKISGLRDSTIKYYSEIGLLPFRQKENRLARRYPVKVSLKRLEKIKQLQARGKSIEEIAAQLKNKASTY